MSTAEVVIIGGGIVDSSIAYHLTAAGCRNVLVIDPFLGPVPEVPGFFLANGFSGHGVMYAPATGKILSDLILEGKTDLIDASLLNLARFAERRMIEETTVL